MLTKNQKIISELLRKPPAPKAHHVDRIPWDQCDLITIAIFDRMSELLDEDLYIALGPPVTNLNRE